MINNIKNNTISEILARKNLNALNEIKKAEIKNKRLIPGQKELLIFFNNLIDTIFTENNNNNNNNDNNNENDNNENDNNDDNDNNDNNDIDYRKIKQLNDYFEMINETKSFEDQIKLLEKINYLNEYWYMKYYDDDKELNLKIFKLKITYISNDIDEKLFEEVFGHTFVTLVNKLINTTNKEENQIIVNDIEKNKYKLYEQDDFHSFVIQPGYQRVNLIDAAKFILEFNETIQLDLV